MSKVHARAQNFDRFGALGIFNLNTIEQILDSEKEMVLSAPARYGKYYENAMECSLFMTHLLKSVSKEASTFAGFHSQVKKHLTLALFSAVRLHENQSMMNIRYALEAGVRKLSMKMRQVFAFN